MRHLPNSFFLTPVDEIEITDTIKSLKMNKSPGIDSIKTEIVKETERELGPLLVNKMFPWNVTCTVILLAFLVGCYSKSSSDYRLPENHIPKNYDLEINIDPLATGFSGQVKISFLTKNKTNSIHLHASYTHMKIKEVTLNKEHSCEVNNVDNETDIAHITCSESIQEGDNNELHLKFDGVYAEFRLGLYKEEYFQEENTEYAVVSQFAVTNARKAFPCFDEPQLKAQFDIIVVHPLNYNALSNSEVINKTIGESQIFTTFKRTPPMSTYLVAFHVSKFDKQDSSALKSSPDDFPITVHYKPYLENFTETALKYGGSLIRAHGIFTGIAYEDLGNSKMDFVGISDFNGAMENWGLVVYDDDSLLDQADETPPEHKQYIIRVIAHELAHQWFGNYVTLNWWSEVWLNEGFANFFDMHYDEKIVGTAMDLERQFVTAILQNALNIDVTAIHPLSNKDEEMYKPDDINRKFNDISYDKGASILRMMRSILGKENFQKGLRRYLQENKLKNVKASTLLKTLGYFYNNSDYSFETLLHKWVYVRGHPIISVSLNDDGKSVQIKQEDVTENSKWYIPISYTSSKEKNFSIRVDEWLFDKPLNIELENNSWIIVNLQQSGFFRVKYDKELWNRIIDALKSPEMNEIHVSNRAQLLDDAFELVGTNISLALAEYVKNEIEYEPWFVVKKRITKLIQKMALNGRNDEVKELKNLTLSWIDQAFPKDKETNLTTHLQKMTKNLIIEFKAFLEDDYTLKQAQETYKEYMSNRRIPDQNKRKLALCYGFKMSKTPKDDLNNLLKFYQESNSSYQRKEILSALGCANDKEILKLYLSEILSSNNRILESHTQKVFSSIYNNNNNGMDVFLTFLSENIGQLNEKYGKSLKFGDILWNSAKKINSNEQLLKMESVIMKQEQYSTKTIVPEKAIELLSDHIARTNQNIEDKIF